MNTREEPLISHSYCRLITFHFPYFNCLHKLAEKTFSAYRDRSFSGTAHILPNSQNCSAVIWWRHIECARCAQVFPRSHTPSFHNIWSITTLVTLQSSSFVAFACCVSYLRNSKLLPVRCSPQEKRRQWGTWTQQSHLHSVLRSWSTWPMNFS